MQKRSYVDKIRGVLENTGKKAYDFAKDHKVAIGGTALLAGITLAARTGSYSSNGLGWGVENIQTIPKHIYELHLNPILYPLSHAIGEGVRQFTEKLPECEVMLHVISSHEKNLPYQALVSYGSAFLADKAFKKAKNKSK